MNLSYQETSKPQTISEVYGQDKESFARYMKAKEAYLKILMASTYPTDKISISLTNEECKLLLQLFNSKEVVGFIV